MGFPTKVQLISRKASEQYYINFPSAVAQAMEFSKGETVEWIVADKGNLILSRKEVPPNPVDVQKKNDSWLLSAQLGEFMESASVAATTTASCATRLHQHMQSMLLCPSTATVSNLICTCGGQHVDWTADYRLYSKERVDEAVLFGRIRDTLIENLAPGDPLVVAIDDTIVRKTGKKIYGSGWKRDPLGPAFQTNLVYAQRYLQLSAAWPLENGAARTVPIDFLHAPTPVKPPKTADPETHKSYREVLKQQNLNRQALNRIDILRREMPTGQHLVIAGDGSYTNQSILCGKPENTTYIGRGRKDMVLHYLPEVVAGANGRPRSYGELAPTPDQLRQDQDTPWQEVVAFAAGRRHTFKIKTIAPVLWRKAGADLPLRIVVISPLGYRLRNGSKLLYRQPAYLICTDPNLSLEKLLQYYLWRWGIELNFREEKTLIGTGEAQVRTPASNQHLPAVTVAAYAILWIVTLHALAAGAAFPSLHPPKWRKDRTLDGSLPATGDLLRLLRFETWAGALRPGTFYHFATNAPPDTNAQKPHPDLPATIFDAA